MTELRKAGTVAKPRKLSSFKPDEKNANRGTKRGREALDVSITKFGFGRSILIDSADRVIAGNKTMEAALKRNPEQKVRVIETDGTEIIAVKRTDLNLDTDAAAKGLAIADNRVAELDLSWNQDVLADLAGDIDLGFLFPKEESAGNVEGDIPEGSYKEQFGVIVLCQNVKEQEAIFTRLQKEGLTVRVVTT